MDARQDSAWRICLDDINAVDLKGPVHATMPVCRQLIDQALDLFIEGGAHEWTAPRRAGCRNGGLEVLKGFADIGQHFRFVEARHSPSGFIHEGRDVRAARARLCRCRAGAPRPPPACTPTPRARVLSL